MARKRPQSAPGIKHRANLKRLRGIYIDCGWRDQYYIHFGSRILSPASPP